MALGGGSLIHNKETRTFVGPDSVGSRLEKESIAFGGETLTVSPASYSDATYPTTNFVLLITK
jgi:N-methylhydantoinase A/oxoprolinase/acetone carboxylase beta subunit